MGRHAAARWTRSSATTRCEARSCTRSRAGRRATPCRPSRATRRTSSSSSRSCRPSCRKPDGSPPSARAQLPEMATTPEILLDPLRVEHLPLVMTWVNDREVMQYFANRQTDIGEEEEKRYIEALTSSKNDRCFSIFDGEVYVGQCSVN